MLLQDWNYVVAHCFEITLELNWIKGRANLPRLFDDNLQSLLNYALVSTLGGCVQLAGNGHISAHLLP